MDRAALFATPICSFADAGNPGVDAELTARLIAEAAREPGLRRSNSGGWHSVPDLSQRPDACYQDLMHRVVAAVRAVFGELARERGAPVPRYRLAVQAWAMIMRGGDHALVHDHPDAHFSCVYYADAGDADADAFPDSGKLTFLDPRRGSTVIPGADLFPSQLSIEPRTGLLVVFPGWLQHFVHPYRGKRPRVSISANVRFEPELGR